MSDCPNCKMEMEKSKQDMEFYFDTTERHGEIEAECCPICDHFEITGWCFK